MTLKRQLVLYIALLNCIPAALGIYFLSAGTFYWFFLVEMSLLVSIPLGFVVIRRALQPMEFIKSSELHLQRGDFATRFVPMDGDELNSVIRLFNGMLEKLHDEQLKLGEQRGFFAKLLQATPTGVVIFDFDERISNVNPAAEQMLGSRLADIKGESIGHLDSNLARSIFESELPCLLSMPTGQRYRVQQSSFYDRGFQRKFLTLEELTAELQSVERLAYEKLIRMTSHEVKNTVGVTNSLLEGCKDYCSQLSGNDREDFTKALAVVINRNLSLAEFMSRLALVVHLPAPDCQPTSLADLLQSIQAMFAVEMKNRNIRWRLECGSLPPVNLDANLFEQALINIVKNGIEAVDRNGEITASTEAGGNGILLKVRDSAGALSEIDKANVFKPFHTSKTNGQGVGLMLIREILNQHGFSYALESEPGQWTEFRIWMGDSGVLSG